MEAAAFAESRTKEDAAIVIDRVKVRSVKHYLSILRTFRERSRKAGLHLWYDVEFDSKCR